MLAPTGDFCFAQDTQVGFLKFSTILQFAVRVAIRLYAKSQNAETSVLMQCIKLSNKVEHHHVQDCSHEVCP